MNDQPLDLQTKRFIYADELCITCQDTRFNLVRGDFKQYTQPVEKVL